jgi:hypothetical protein
MKMSQPQLLVGLQEKMSRVDRHWVRVNQELPPDYPLVLLLGVQHGAFQELAERLPGLRQALRAPELKRNLARAEYERCKRAVHGWLKRINVWMRARVRGTPWILLMQRVPGLGQSYGHWSDAALGARATWGLMEKNPPDICIGWPMNLGEGRTLEQFASVVQAFDGAVRVAERDLKLARASLWLAQKEAARLLMAYGHGVRARLGEDGTLVRSMPELWPKNSASSKKTRKRSRTRNCRGQLKARASAA